jgi:hypothetical protein
MKHYIRSEDVLDFYGYLFCAFAVVGIVLLVASFVRADSVLCGSSVFFGLNVFPCGEETPTTTTTATTYTTTTTHKTALPPSVLAARQSKIRNMSYDYTEPPQVEYTDPLSDFLGWFGRIFG